MMVCPNCGKPISAGDKFCMVCGQKLIGDGDSAAQQQTGPYLDGTTITPISMPGGAVPTQPAPSPYQPAPVPFVQPSRPSQVSQTAPVSLASQTGAYQQPVQPQPVAAPSAGIPTPLAAPGQSGQPAYADPSSPTVPPTGGKRRNTRKIVVVTVIVLLAVVIAVCAGLWIWSTSAASGSARKSAERYLQMIETGDYSGANAFAKRDGHGSDNVDELPATDKKIMQDVESITDYGIDGRPESVHPWPTEYLVKVHYSVDGIRRDRTLRVTASNPIAAVQGKWTISGMEQQLDIVIPSDVSGLSINAGTFTYDEEAGNSCRVMKDSEYPGVTDSSYGDSFRLCRLSTWPGVYQVGPDSDNAFQVSAATGIADIGENGDGSDAAVQPVFFVASDGSGFLQVDANGAVLSRGQGGNTGDDTSDSASQSTPQASKLAEIADSYSSSDVAISAMFLNDSSSPSSSGQQAASADDVANTKASRTRFVSAGLYLPVYLAAQDEDSSIKANADTMMQKMDNDAGNQAILGMGGFDTVNSWLSSHGYDDTTFDRHYGDVKASSEGHENYSSTFDAVRLLAAVDQAGGTSLMTADIAKEGVKIPSGMTVHAHRGQGIKDTWNYFIIVENSHGKAAIAIATQNQGKEKAAEIASRVLAEMNDELNQLD